MRNLIDMDTIQIEITNHCINQCSNCTRFVGHIQSPYYMDWETFKSAVDSLEGYPKMVGIQGGEPLLHPEFERFCDYLLQKFEPRQLGLWTTLPKGFEFYRTTIVKTFHHIFLNDHTRNDIYHHPGLVSAQEVWKSRERMFYHIDRCWVQESWSASINPRGAFFCEIAASLSMLYPNEVSYAWKPKTDWWWATPKDFTAQIEQWCPKCGFCVPLKRRSSNDKIDDISPYHYEQLKDTSPKIKSGAFKIHDLSVCKWEELNKLAAYKDTQYRNVIAKRYGMRVEVNESNFWSPYLLSEEHKSYLEQLQEKFK